MNHFKTLAPLLAALVLAGCATAPAVDPVAIAAAPAAFKEAPAPGAGEALYRVGSLRASYFHAWFASSPRAVAHLLGGEGA